MTDFDYLAYPRALRELIEAFRGLPGIGPRSAERLVLALLQWPDERLQQFGTKLAELKTRIRACTVCGNLSEEQRCSICCSAERDQSKICVVEQPTQILVLERSGAYNGHYHVLGGRLAPLDGQGPEQLNLEPLRQRLATGEVKELILATSLDVEGEATAAFLAQEFRSAAVSISRIASGMPVGGDLAFADVATLAVALQRRRNL